MRMNAMDIEHCPVSYEEVADSPAELLKLRHDRPVCRVRMPTGDPAWLITRYRDAQLVLGDSRFTRDLRFTTSTRAGGAPPEEFVVDSDRTLAMDGPAHLALRRLVARAFSAARMEARRPRIQQITDDLLDQVAEQPLPVDLIKAYAAPLPVQVICELLGVPDDNREQFRTWSDATVSVTAHSPDEVSAAWAGLLGYFTDLIQQRREDPGEDLISALIAARDGGDRLTETEMVFLAIGVLIGGNETTVNAIVLGLCQLWQHPRELAALRDDPSLIDTAVEELLRYEPLSGLGRRRLVKTDLELSGVPLSAGDNVILSMRSANRDEDHFDNAEHLCLARKNNPHLAFGHGPHYCLGASLARVELQIALSSLLRRFPGLSPAVPLDQIPRKTGLMVTGLHELPVTW
jgi:cytochrome P450